MPGDQDEEDENEEYEEYEEDQEDSDELKSDDGKSNWAKRMNQAISRE